MKQPFPLFKKAVVASFQGLFVSCSKDITNEIPSGPVLVIAPHPDDETLGCGAMIARLCAQGRAVLLIAVTNGEDAPTPEHRAQIATIRRAEFEAAAHCLGVKKENVIFLNHPDHHAPQHVEEIARDMATQIKNLAPALILSPYGLDGTQDHVAVAKALDIAAHKADYRGLILEYPIWFWPFGALRHILRLRPLLTHRLVRAAPYLNQKRAALAAHRSRTERLTPEETWRPLDEAFLARFFKPYELFFEKRRTR